MRCAFWYLEGRTLNSHLETGRSLNQATTIVNVLKYIQTHQDVSPLKYKNVVIESPSREVYNLILLSTEQSS